MTNIIDIFSTERKNGNETDNKLSFHFYYIGPSHFDIHFRVPKTTVQQLIEQSNERAIKNPQAYLERSIKALLTGKAYLKSQGFRRPIISAMTLTWLERSTTPLDSIKTQSTFPNLVLIYYKPDLSRTGNPRCLFTYSEQRSNLPNDVKSMVNTQILIDRRHCPHYFKSAKVLKF